MKTSYNNSYSFTKGSLVEVNGDSDGFYCVWYVVKVLVPPPFPTTNKRTKTAFHVEYQTLVTDDGSQPLTEFFYSTLIRPLPPPSETDHAFEVNDVVDAFYLDGWWIGVVVKVLESNRYSVYFENPPDRLEFKRSDLRAHWDWDGCKWVRPQKKKIQQKESGTGSLKRERAECQNPLIKGKKCDGAGVAVDETVVKDDAIIDVESPKYVEDPNGKECYAAGSAIDKLAVKDCATNDVESRNITGESIVSEDASTEKAVILSDIGCNSREAETAIVEVPNIKAIIHKPISICFYGFCPPTVVGDSRSICAGTFNQLDEAKRRQSEFATECTANESMSDGVLDKSRCLPYVESSSILKAVESLEVFQMMPQKPHFNPLEKCKELYREGLAIAYMLTFANVVKQTSKLQVGDPRSMFNCIFEALGDLESHGFNVKTVRTRLTELQSIKERQEQLKEEWKGFGDQITEQTHEQTKFKAEFGGLLRR